MAGGVAIGQVGGGWGGGHASRPDLGRCGDCRNSSGWGGWRDRRHKRPRADEELEAERARAARADSLKDPELPEDLWYKSCTKNNSAISETRPRHGKLQTSSSYVPHELPGYAMSFLMVVSIEVRPAFTLTQYL